jgi:hypothetical protein
MRKYILFALLQMFLGQKKKKYYRHSPDDIFVYDKSGREIFRESRNGYRSYGRFKKPKIFRYAKFAALALVLFVFTIGSLAVWGFVKAINYAGDLAKEAPIAEKISQGEEKLRAAWEQPTAVTIEESKAKLAQFANQPITTEACLKRLSGLLMPSTWLTRPVAANWQIVKEACVKG